MRSKLLSWRCTPRCMHSVLQSLSHVPGRAAVPRMRRAQRTATTAFVRVEALAKAMVVTGFGDRSVSKVQWRRCAATVYRDRADLT